MLQSLKKSFFRKVFLSYLIVITLISTVFLGMFYQQINNKQIENSQGEYSEYAETMRRTIDRKFDEIKMIGAQIRSTLWYPHAIATGYYYDDFFDSSTKQNIGRELLSHTATVGVIDTIALNLPLRGEMVSTPGWNSTDTTLRLLGITDLADRTILTNRLKKAEYFEIFDLSSLKVSSRKPYTMAIIQGIDYLSINPRSSLLILVNNNMLGSYISKICPSKVISLSILQEGQTLYTYQSHDSEEIIQSQRFVTLHLKSQSYPCEYEIQVKKSLFSTTSQFFMMLGIFLALFILEAFTSYWLTGITYRPLSRLLSLTRTTRQTNEFEGLENSFKQIEAQNQEMEQKMHRFYESAKSNFLLRLLRGYFSESDIDQMLETYQITYNDRQTFRVVLCRLKGKEKLINFKNLKSILTLQNLICERSRDAEFIELSATECAFILSDTVQDDKEICNWIRNVQKSAQEENEQSISLYCGTSEEHLIGISKSFQNACEQANNDSFENSSEPSNLFPEGRSFYYPTDWEIQLINAIKVGNQEIALKIISELKKENMSRKISQSAKIKVTSVIFETIIRVVDELGMDTLKAERLFNENLSQYADKKQWQYLCELAQSVCSRSSYAVDGTSTDSMGIGKKMLTYVEQNYQNFSLSLKDLSNEFNLSMPSISRIFKATARIGFYDYCCRIRMEKAKELMRTNKLRMSDIVKAVGYDNDASFRRTFLRYEGISPHDYLMKHI